MDIIDSLTNLYHKNETFGVLVRAVFKITLAIIIFVVIVQVSKILEHQGQSGEPVTTYDR